MDESDCVGAIVCKLDVHKKMVRRGYIAMLAVDSQYRRRKIGKHGLHNLILYLYIRCYGAITSGQTICTLIATFI